MKLVIRLYSLIEEAQLDSSHVTGMQMLSGVDFLKKRDLNCCSCDFLKKFAGREIYSPYGRSS